MAIDNLAQMATIIKDKKVLALEFNDYEGSQGIEGKWVLPGGRPDIGEHVHDALKREVREETGLEVEVVEPISVNNFKNWDGQERIRITYLCELKEDKEVSLSHEHKSYKWIEAEEVHSLDWIDEHFKEIVETALAKTGGVV